MKAIHPDEDTGSGVHKGRPLRLPIAFALGTIKAGAWQV